MAKVGAKGPRVILDKQDPRLADLLAFIERALVGETVSEDVCEVVMCSFVWYLVLCNDDALLLSL